MEPTARYKPRVKTTQKKGIDFTTHTMDMDMSSYLDLKSIVYELKREDPRFTQRKAIGKAIELLKIELEQVGITLDHSKVIDEIREHSESIRIGIAESKGIPPAGDRSENTSRVNREKTLSWILKR